MCTIGRKFWFSDSGGCTITDISGREKRQVEERLKACGALDSDDEISSVVEAVSFDDTLGEIERVADEGLNEDRVIPVSSVEMYEVIADFGEMIGSDKTTQVDTKYKTVDRKVRPVAAPLREGSEERMKGVA